MFYFQLTKCLLFIFLNCCLICLLCDVHVIAKYSSSGCDVNGTRITVTVKREVMDYSSNSEDVLVGNSSSCLSAEQDQMLTDIQEVLSCDTTEHCDVSTPALLLSYDLNTTEHVSSQVSRSGTGSSLPACSTADSLTVTNHNNNESTASMLPRAESRSPGRQNRLAAAVAAASKLQNQPNKPS